MALKAIIGAQSFSPPAAPAPAAPKTKQVPFFQGGQPPVPSGGVPQTIFQTPKATPQQMKMWQTVYNGWNASPSDKTTLPQKAGEVWYDLYTVEEEMVFDAVNPLDGLYYFRDKHGMFGFNADDLLRRYRRKEASDPWKKQKEYAANNGFVWRDALA